MMKVINGERRIWQKTDKTGISLQEMIMKTTSTQMVQYLLNYINTNEQP